MRLPKYKTKFNYFHFDLGKKSLPAKDDALLVTFIFCSYIVAPVIRHYNKAFNKNHESEYSQIPPVRLSRARVRVLKRWPRVRTRT